MVRIFDAEGRTIRRRKRSPGRGSRRCAEGDASVIDEPHSSPSDPARDTASVRELAASFEKMRLTCDFSVSGEIWLPPRPRLHRWPVGKRQWRVSTRRRRNRGGRRVQPLPILSTPSHGNRLHRTIDILERKVAEVLERCLYGLLKLDGGCQGVDGACEFDQRAVAGQLDMPSPVAGQNGTRLAPSGASSRPHQPRRSPPDAAALGPMVFLLCSRW